MQISTVGYDIMTCSGVDVPPGETYEIDFGLNVAGSPNMNPYAFTGGMASPCL